MPGTRTLQFYCLDQLSKMPRTQEEMTTLEVRRFIANHPFPVQVGPIVNFLKACPPTDTVKVDMPCKRQANVDTDADAALSALPLPTADPCRTARAPPRWLLVCTVCSCRAHVHGPSRSHTGRCGSVCACVHREQPGTV